MAGEAMLMVDGLHQIPLKGCPLLLSYLQNFSKVYGACNMLLFTRPASASMSDSSSEMVMGIGVSKNRGD